MNDRRFVKNRVITTINIGNGFSSAVYRCPVCSFDKKKRFRFVRFCSFLYIFFFFSSRNLRVSTVMAWFYFIFLFFLCRENRLPLSRPSIGYRWRLQRKVIVRKVRWKLTYLILDLLRLIFRKWIKFGFVRIRLLQVNQKNQKSVFEKIYEFTKKISQRIWKLLNFDWFNIYSLFTDGEDEEDDDYSASVSVIMQRRESTRRTSSKKKKRRPSSPFSGDGDSGLYENRRSSVYTNSSGE